MSERCDIKMNSKYKCDFTIIGKRIGNARKLKRMTQDQLAKRIGIGVKHLSEIERGVSGVAVGTLIEIATVLDVSTDYLLLGKEPQNSSVSTLLAKLDSRQRYYLEQVINNFVRCCVESDM